jgi:hypothetical protein
MDGGRRIKNIARKRSLSGDTVLFHENTGLEALHFHGKVKQFKVRLPLALSKLFRQSIFQKVKRLI